ncbi:zonula occludens toxin [Variovorax sp. CF313]|uniref:zonula occludens toxin n=1 Tax=Variovorax sp. CF313 TaxID=1144315 RepID=UPI000270E49D|nr:zonula occludens toxin [Variovorax sp. CF313]EJL70750.1 zonula occludens toxin [Variovorax sp. CF313]
MISALLSFWRPLLTVPKLGFIYLTTGANGTGKTAFTLKAVREMQVKENRPVYWNGRFDLTEEKQKEFGWIKIEADKWQTVPDGAIFFFDECHNDFPDRSSGAKVPEHVRMLGEHRRRGFDFFLLTQHPGNIDPFIRKIIASPGWHRHLKRNFGSSLISHIDYLAVCDRPEKPGAGKAGTVSMKALPKDVFGWYKSAELHTAKIKIPRQVWIFLATLVVIPVCIYLTFQFLRKSTAPKEAAAVAAPAQAGSGQQVASGRVRTASEYIADYRPRIPSLMHTAPAYDKLTEPRRVPVPAACIEIPKTRLGEPFGCKCYTQDATPYPVDLSMCRQLVAHGSFFAFLPEGEKAATTAVVARAADVPQVRQDRAEAPSGLTLIDGPRPTPTAAVAPVGLSAQQPHVQPGSKWSFQAGGQ